MSDMVERVAKAMAELDRPTCTYSVERWWAIRGKDFTEKARVALAAMREPTTCMIDAAAIMVDDPAPHPFIVNMQRAMIDAALKDDR